MKFCLSFQILNKLFFFNICRSMSYRKTQIYLPKPLTLVVIDIITLLPYYELYFLLKSKSQSSTEGFAKDYLRIKVIGRLTTVLHFFQCTYNEPGLNHIVLITIKQIIIFFLYAMSISSAWYRLSFESKSNWTATLQYHQFNNNSMSAWFILSFSTIGNCLAHNYSGMNYIIPMFKISH